MSTAALPSSPEIHLLRTPLQALGRQTRLRPGATAVVDLKTGDETSWWAWAAEIRRLQDVLRRRGVTADSIIVHVGENHRLVWSLALAAIELGAHFWPANYRWSQDEFQRAIDALPSRPALTIATKELADRLPEDLPMVDRDALLEPVDVSVEELAGPPPASEGTLLIATGGTTGAPRLVSLDNAKLSFNAQTFAEATGLSVADRVLVAAPNFHVAGFSTLTLAALEVGASLYIARRFEPAAVLQAIQARKLTATVMVPTMWRALFDQNTALDGFRDLRVGICGGAPMDPRLLEEADRVGVDLIQGYGMTEAGPMVTLMPRGRIWRRHRSLCTSSGLAPRVIEVRVLDEEGKACPPGTPGQICISGPNVVGAYFSGDDASDAFDGETFRTADTGFLDAMGFLHVLGRRDEMILSGGELIAPAEVEAALRRLPAVKEAAVLSLSDTYWGERVVAILTLHDPERAENISEMVASLRPLLAGYKLPTEVRIAPDLPLTPAGKLARCRLSYLWKKAAPLPS